VEEGGIVEGRGKGLWAAAMGDRQEHATKTGTISYKITKYHQAVKRLGKARCTMFSTELTTKDSGIRRTGNNRPTKMKQITSPLREMVPIRTEQKARADHDAPPI
jgi:hypothetical protein